MTGIFFLAFKQFNDSIVLLVSLVVMSWTAGNVSSWVLKAGVTDFLLLQHSSFLSIHISCRKGLKEDLNQPKKRSFPLSEVALSLCDRVSFTNNTLNCFQLNLNTCNPKQWSPSHQQPWEARFPSPRNEETRTLTLSTLESTHPNLPLHCLPTSTTACQQITLTRVFYGYLYLLVNVTIERGVKMVGRSVFD